MPSGSWLDGMRFINSGGADAAGLATGALSNVFVRYLARAWTGDQPWSIVAVRVPVRKDGNNAWEAEGQESKVTVAGWNLCSVISTPDMEDAWPRFWVG